MNFFKYFPQTGYQFQSNGNYTLAITNPTVHVRLLEKLKKNITVLYDYAIQDGERPDTVSVNLYGTPDYTWVILLLNQIFTLFDWPLMTDEFDNYIIEKYGSVVTAQQTLYYKTFDGYLVDKATWDALTGAERDLVPLTAYDDELNKNEAKRRIKIVPVEFVAPIALELKKLMSL